ncbi:MAG: threonine-phosphate decarboxylase, partial [Candidatus Bathyarchaeia archaeon]
IDKKITSTALKEQMAKEGILIRDCSTFVGLGDSYFRVTVRSAEENLKLINALKSILKRNA